jgi:hypothetical protein
MGELFCWWVFYYSPLGIPTHIPGTPINISGLSLIVLFSAVIVWLQKRILKLNRKTSLGRLVLAGCLVIFLSEFVFQSIRLSSIAKETWKEKLYFGLSGVIGMTLMAFVISIISASLLRRKFR